LIVLVTGALGWAPRYGFGEFLEAFRRGDAGHYPFAGLPQWGLSGEI
jgi:hypothetical protein